MRTLFDTYSDLKCKIQRLYGKPKIEIEVNSQQLPVSMNMEYKKKRKLN